jgi:tetratricopeptide (TPR) repeat protein
MKERRSLQDRIRERQQSGFVGRQGQVTQYQENFGLSVDDERRRFIFNIHGDAGVGKTFLVRQLRQAISSAGALVAYVDETSDDVTSAMTVMAAEFGRAGSRFSDFEKRVTEYRQRRHELESDPHAPTGVAAFLTRTAVTIGLAAARDIPFAGSLLAPVDAAAAAEQANLIREYLSRKISDHRDVKMMLSPADELSPVFVADLNRFAEGKAVALFFDTYERTGAILDQWLRSLYGGVYGNLPETLITTISGQKPLDPNLWGEYLPVIADVPLEPFSEVEARQFLASKAITDEPTIQVIITLSGRLPLWLATLADARLKGTADIGDPSGNAVERFLKWETDSARREIAMAAALPRVINQDVLAVLRPTDEARELFDWLRTLPFVARRGESWAYHDVVRAAMLRLRRPEAPVEWRAEQNALATANARWASVADEGTESTWANSEWIDYTREQTYHQLCADPYGNLPSALSSAVKAAEHSAVRARQWAALIGDAGRDTDNDRLSEWGNRLRESIADDDLLPYFTCLINYAELDEKSLIVALEQRGESFRGVGRNEDALADFNRVINLDPSLAWAIGSRGQTYLAMGRYDDALADFNKAIELDPNLTWALTSRGQAYRDMNLYDEALADFNKVLETRPESAWPLANRGDVLRYLGRHEDALTDFNRAIQLDSDLTWAIDQRGHTYRAIGRFEEALSDFSRVMELHSDSGGHIANRGETLWRLGRYEDALADFNLAVTLEPEESWIIDWRGDVYHDMGLYGEALSDYSRAVELAPEGVQPLIDRGDAYRHLDRYDEALTDFSRAIALAPEYPATFSERGETYRLMDLYEEALADLNRAIELDPNYAWALGTRGQIYAGMDLYEDAISDFNRTIELNPHLIWALESRAHAYAAMQRYDEALADLDHAIELDPNDADLVAQRSEILQLMDEGNP